MLLRLLLSSAMCFCLHFAYSRARPPYLTSPAATSKDSQGVWRTTVGPVKPDIAVAIQVNTKSTLII